VAGKGAFIVPGPFEKIEFPVVVSDQSDPLADIHPQSDLFQHRLHGRSFHGSVINGSNTPPMLSEDS
jgi:hypothetical protein